MNLDVDNAIRMLLVCLSVCCGIVQACDVEFVAHRGASKDAPENTLAALKLGWEQTVSCEIDVRLTSDGQIVLMHDDTAKRTAGADLAISKTTLAELRRLDAGSWKGVQWAGEKIPTLAEVLAVQPAGKRLFIEIKCGEEILPELERVLREAKKQPDQIVLICFKLNVMKEAKVRFPALKVIWLASPDKKDPNLPKIDSLVSQAGEAGLDGLDLDYRFNIDAASVKMAGDAGLKLYVWTVDMPEVARRLVDAGVRGITTNRPEWLRRQLEPSS